MNWKALSDRVPLTEKAIAAGRWHRCAMLRQAAAVRAFRVGPANGRSQESYWIVIEACLAHLEGRTLTQKDLAAQATGTASAATISRAISTLEERDFIVVRVFETDARVRIIEPSAKALGIFMSRAEAAWQAFWSIAEAAMRSGEETVKVT
jgi:hypothetical protein